MNKYSPSQASLSLCTAWTTTHFHPFAFAKQSISHSQSVQYLISKLWVIFLHSSKEQQCRVQILWGTRSHNGDGKKRKIYMNKFIRYGKILSESSKNSMCSKMNSFSSLIFVLIFFVVINGILCAPSFPRSLLDVETESVNSTDTKLGPSFAVRTINQVILHELKLFYWWIFVLQLTYLRKYGYLESSDSNSSETLYSELKVSEALKLMQKFRAIKQTGRLDEATLKVKNSSPWLIYLYLNYFILHLLFEISRFSFCQLLWWSKRYRSFKK